MAKHTHGSHKIKPPRQPSKRLTLVALSTATVAGAVGNPTSRVVRKAPGNLIARNRKG
jgi:hypothetical protein